MTPPKPNPSECPYPERRQSDTRLAVVESEVRNINRRLFGNGHPGDLENLSSDFFELRGEMSRRFNEIEKKIGRVMLGVAFLAGLAGYSGSSLLKTLLGAL